MKGKQELKPCPFCGGAGVVESTYNSYEDRHVWQVACNKCFCAETIWYKRQHLAIQRWNKRWEGK